MAAKTTPIREYIIDKINQKQDVILTDLYNSIGYTPSVRTLRQIKKELIQQGYPISTRSKNGKWLYDDSTAKSLPIISDYATCKKTHIRQAILLLILANLFQKTNKKYISQSAWYQEASPILYPNSSQKYASKDNTFQKDIKELIKQNFLEKRNRHHNSSGRNTEQFIFYRFKPDSPTILKGDYETIQNIARKLDILSQSSSDATSLSRIQQIIEGALSFETLEHATDGQNYLHLGSQYVAPEALEKVRSLFDSINFKNRELIISYMRKVNTKNSENRSDKESLQEIQVRLRARLLYYAQELDRFYLISDDVTDTKKEAEIRIPVDQILSVTETAIKHSRYRDNPASEPEFADRYYLSIYSYTDRKWEDASSHIKITFNLKDDTTGFYTELLRSYAQARVKQTEKLGQNKIARFIPDITQTAADEVIYEDECYGLPELRAFLRRFGNRAIVTAPQTLKEAHSSSARRIQNRYASIEAQPPVSQDYAYELLETDAITNSTADRMNRMPSSLNTQDAIHRILLIISMLTNSAASNSMNAAEMLPYYFSINRLHRILHVPHEILRNDIFQLFLYFGAYEGSTISPLPDKNYDFASHILTHSVSAREHKKTPLYQNEYPVDNEAYQDMFYELIDIFNGEYESAYTKEDSNSLAILKNKLISGAYDRLPFHIDVYSKKSTQRYFSDINVAMTYSQYQLLFDFFRSQELPIANPLAKDYTVHTKSLYANADSALLEKNLQKIQSYIAKQTVTACSYQGQELYILPLQIVYFSQKRTYYAAVLAMNSKEGAMVPTPLLLKIAEIRFKRVNSVIPEQRVQAFSTDKADKQKKQFLADLPYMWGPTYEKKTKVKIYISDDNHGNVWRKTGLALYPYVGLRGNTLSDNLTYMDTAAETPYQCRCMCFEGTIIDQEAFASWVMGYGNSIMVEKPLSLKKRILNNCEKLLSQTD